MAKKKKIEIVETGLSSYKPESSINLEGDDCIEDAKLKEKVTARITMVLERFSMDTERMGEKEEKRMSQRWRVSSIETDGEESEDKEDKSDSIKKYGMGRSLK